MHPLLICFVLSQMLLVSRVQCECPESFECGRLGTMRFPFSNVPDCGFYFVNCTDMYYTTVKLWAEQNWLFRILEQHLNTLKIQYPFKNCNSFGQSFPKNSVISLTYHSNVEMLRCENSTVSSGTNKKYVPPIGYRKFGKCQQDYMFDIYYNLTNGRFHNYTGVVPSGCLIIRLPMQNDKYISHKNVSELYNVVDDAWVLEFNLSQTCQECLNGGHQCEVDRFNNFRCSGENVTESVSNDINTNNETKSESNDTNTLSKTKSESNEIKFLILFAVTTVWVCNLSIWVIIFFFWRRKKRKTESSSQISRNTSFDPSSEPELETGIYYGVPVYTYKELEDATENFNASKELGDGGFGIVYHGKLKDGREVAVKRLHQHNYKRIEQFMNEIRILTSLRHPNLVSLYGCTSSHSREQLLVYEFVSNGTVADHLHGNKATYRPLTWPVRMSIALETANALSYLHKSDIIHRDIKTTNILLDDNFSVKVADFGLSRLIPTDATHISTSPQGTPGYVDPQYHECYQLTDKSDVYSFGVVLIELLSSLPAVDINRQNPEINLANLAVRRIQKNEVDELIDPSLGYDSDPDVKRMANAVAELAFLCLQHEKDMRPTMHEALAALEAIKDNKHRNGTEKVSEKGKEGSPGESEDAVLLRKLKSSPVSVDQFWTSGSSTTTNYSA